MKKIFPLVLFVTGFLPVWGQGSFLPVPESFETGFGNWMQSGTDTMDWTRITGATPSSSTGPVSAFDGSYYIYTEATGASNKTAELISGTYQITAAQDLTFQYQMYGAYMGSLAVSVSTDNGATWQEVWRRTGHQGIRWTTATIDLSGYVNSLLKIKFSGTTGSGDTSDIAIDNINFVGAQSPVGSCGSVLSPENYVFTRTYKKKAADITDPLILSSDDVTEEVTYFDGLGRPSQHVGIEHADVCEDIVTTTAYDAFGREDKKYLPYPDAAGTPGSYRTGDVVQATKNYYDSKFPEDFTSTVVNPYSETKFDTSPLNRVLEQGAPGASWAVNQAYNSDHTVKFEYTANALNEVRLYRVSLSSVYVPTLVQSAVSYYEPGELFKNITKDENWASGVNNTTEEFKDKQGRVVLKRTYNAGAPHDTYYVYDDYGNLTYVIPPKADATTTTVAGNTTKLNELCYQYKYDYRNRLVEKKIPGKGWEYIVYNKLDQPILTQDEVQRNKSPKEWLFTKYDAFGRVIMTGIHTYGTTTTSQSTMQSVVNAYKGWEEKTTTSTNNYYTNLSYPTSNLEVLTLNYYDNYTFDTTTQGLVIASGTDIFGNLVSHNVKGLSTGSKVKVLDQSPVKWITTVNHYDKKGNILYTGSYNDFLETTDKVKMELDFIGTVKKTETYHKRGTNSAITTIDNFTYDHVNRLTHHTQTIGTKTELIAHNTYDKIGELISKEVGNTELNPLQLVNYTYNVRGWLKGINNTGGSASLITLGTGDLYGFQINYDKPTDLSKALFNGNISQTLWRSRNTDQNQRNYLYTYDNLNRLTNAISNDGKFDVGGSSLPITYDKNGNITSMHKKGAIVENPLYNTPSHFGVMDYLTYSYDSGNKLTAVNDTGNVNYGFKDASTSTTQYTYDLNGNLTSDANKGILTGGIKYNHLNLPTEVKFNNSTSQVIKYTYDATGVKLRKEIPGKITDYAGNFVYEGGTLQFFNHPEGHVSYDGGQFNYVYNYIDHLGNIRLSYTDENGNGIIETGSTYSEIIQEKNYYPFGLTHQGYNNNGSPLGNDASKRYGFGGKELQNESVSGNILDWYDFGARNYDSSLGRWMNIDNMSEDYISWSPYNYTLNNPIYFTDPDGNSVNDLWSYNVDTEKLEWINDTGGDQVQIVQITNNEGEALGSGAVGGNEVHVAKLENSVFISNYDAVSDIPTGYNSKSGYSYTGLDLKKRHQLKELGGIFWGQIREAEAGGEATPVHSKTAYNAYVEKWGTNSAFWFGAEHYFAPDGVTVADDALRALKGYGEDLSSALSKSKASFRSFSAKSSAYKSASGTVTTRGSISRSAQGGVSQLKNSWNQFLRNNKGRYSGENWVKKAAADYKALQGAN